MNALDIVIIGGGPAGMAAALVAGRARLNTVVLNTEAPRNAVTQASHGFLTRDGAHPIALLAAAKEQLVKYRSVKYVVASASSVEAHGGHYVVIDDAGERWTTQRVVIATGYRDDLTRLHLPGIEAVYGRSAFPCPFCDGFEHADERLAVFAGAGAEHFAPVVRVWSRDVVVFTNGKALEPGARSRLESGGVRVEQGRVARLVSEQGRLRAVELEDGSVVERDAAFVGEEFSAPATDFAARLGVPLTENDWGMQVSEADERGKTRVEGVFIVGDSRSVFGGLTAAARDGAACAEGIVHEIAVQRWTEATG